MRGPNRLVRTIEAELEARYRRTLDHARQHDGHWGEVGALYDQLQKYRRTGDAAAQTVWGTERAPEKLAA